MHNAKTIAVFAQSWKLVAVFISRPPERIHSGRFADYTMQAQWLFG